MKRKGLWLALAALTGWILTDLYWPRQVDLRQFDPVGVARLDAAMWRSYYDRRPLLLFWQSAQLCRQQLKTPFWRSFVIAGHAAKAAFVFKDGTTRTDYARALPDLAAFYGDIARLSTRSLNVSEAARNELEWWIIRRERDRHPPAEWAALQTRIAAGVYHLPLSTCVPYGQFRTQAMLLRDQKGDHITDRDWQQIQTLLTEAWQSLATAN